MSYSLDPLLQSGQASTSRGRITTSISHNDGNVTVLNATSKGVIHYAGMTPLGADSTTMRLEIVIDGVSFGNFANSVAQKEMRYGLTYDDGGGVISLPFYESCQIIASASRGSSFGNLSVAQTNIFYTLY